MPKSLKNTHAELLKTPSLDRNIAQAKERLTFNNDWPANNWWLIFNDKELNSLIEEAILSNPAIAEALAKLGEARALAGVAKSKLLPHFEFDAVDNWQRISAYNEFSSVQNFVMPLSQNLVDLKFFLNYDLDLFGKNRKTWHAALGRAKAQEAEAFYTQLLITTSLTSSYFSLKSDYLKRATLEKLKQEKVLVLNLTLERKTHAIDDEINVKLVKEQIQALDIALADMENRITLAKHFILAILGKGPEGDIAVSPGDLPLNVTLSLPSSLSLELLARRSDLMAEIWRVNAAAAEVGAAKAAFYPNINLMSFAGLESILWNKLFSWDAKLGDVNPTISFPLYTGGELTSNLKAKNKAFEEAVYSYNEKVLSAVKEVADNLATFMKNKKTEAFQREKVSLAKGIYDLSQKRTEIGLDNALTLSDTLSSVLQEELMLIDQMENEIISIVQLIQSLGGGYNSTEEKTALKGTHG